MKNSIIVSIVVVMALVAAPARADGEIPEVPGIIGMTPVEAGSCMAIYVPLPGGDALAGVMWYNNDETVVYPEVLVASGVAGSPEPVTSAFRVAEDVSGASSGWSELTFTEPIAPASDGMYVVFRLPEGSEHTADGEGGGAGIGYTVGANGYTGWLSLDGEEWCKLHDDYGMALDPITVPAEDGMTEKSSEDETELPVTHTAFHRPAPNPFNPQTELRFQLKDASDVELSIYNVRGERVAQVASGAYPSGRYAITWRGTDTHGRRLASGAYFARFRADYVETVQRLLLVK